MKNSKIIVLAVLISASAAIRADISTLYFLENAPMRHLVNPAFQPVSDGYVNFSPLGYMDICAGNNRLTISDLIYNDPISGNTITALHPNADKQQLMNTLKNSISLNTDMQLDIASFGIRIHEKGYVHINIMEHVEAGITGSWNSIHAPVVEAASTYTEIGGGYSHKINDCWTVGGKAKFLLGQAYENITFNEFSIASTTEQMRLVGNGDMVLAAPINMAALPDRLSYDYFAQHGIEDLFSGMTIADYLTPKGYGAAFDLGFTCKPIKNLQITASITDLGFICWKGKGYTVDMDTTYHGVGDVNLSDMKQGGEIQVDTIVNRMKNDLLGIVKSIHADAIGSNCFTRMTKMHINIGVDANFCNNILGIGILSSTRLYNGRLYEEVTIGGAVRPCNWFNFALSYSLVNNGKYSNLGMGLSFMPYDGINLTLAMDYIPTSYAAYDGIRCIPYESKGVNVALGFSIVWGTNPKKAPLGID